MKSFFNRLTFGLGVALIAAGLLVGVAEFAPNQVQVARAAVLQVTTTVVDTVLPAPTPTPTPAPTVAPTLAPAPPVNTAPPTPVGPRAFPAPSQMPGCGTCPTPPALQVGAPTPAPVAIPQTYVSVAVVSVNGNTNPPVDKNTGGYTGQPGMVIVYQAYFQGGFPGVTPIFTWNGTTAGTTYTMTYNTVGLYHETLSVTEVYNGVTYGAGSINSVPIMVCTSGATNNAGQCA